jgi:HK97 family phage prohead protease
VQTEQAKQPQTVRKQFTLEEIGKGEETPDGLRLSFTLSTAHVDRDKDIIHPGGWKLMQYRKNPVVLWAHQTTEPPVAKSLEERVDKGKLTSVALFTPKDLNPFGHMIGEMYAKGFLRAVSVGFQGLNWSYAKEKERAGGMDFHEQELLEYSCVPVPANPEALLGAKSAGIDLIPLKEWAEKILDGEGWISKEKAVVLYHSINEPKTISIPTKKRIPLSLWERQLQINEKGSVFC